MHKSRKKLLEEEAVQENLTPTKDLEVDESNLAPEEKSHFVFPWTFLIIGKCESYIRTYKMILFPLLIASLLSFGNSQMLLNEGLIKDNQYLEFFSKDDGTYIINSLTQNDLTEYRLYSKYKDNN